MKRLATTAPLLLALAGCSDDPIGLRAQGSIELTVRQAGQPDGRAGFTLPSNTLVDPPPGVGMGFYGSCTRTGTTWAVDITRADSAAGGLRRVLVQAPQGTSAAGVTAKFTLGTTDFDGSASCQSTVAPSGADGVALTVTCTDVRASGDPRALDARVSLTLSRCTLR